MPTSTCRYFLSLLFTFTLCLLCTSIANAVSIAETTSDPMQFTFSVDHEESPTGYEWDFGDGQTSTLSAPTHTYDVPGTYRVSLRLTLPTSQTLDLLTVVEAGSRVRYLDFEDWPNPFWLSTEAKRSEDAAIEGDYGYPQQIDYPRAGDTCITPDHDPGGPGGFEPQRGADVYSFLLDLEVADVAVGGRVALWQVLDDQAIAIPFELVLHNVAGVLELTITALDDLLNVHQATAVVSRDQAVKIELQAWLASAQAPAAGGLRLRALDADTMTTLFVLSELDDLANGSFAMSEVRFGSFDSDYPLGSSGLIHLDALEVRSNACIAPSAAGLIGHWDFENIDLGFDSSTADRHGTVFGTALPIVGRTRPDGTTENALELTGAGHIELPALDTPLDGLERVTVEAWIHVDDHVQTNIFRAQQPLGLGSDRLQVVNRVDDDAWASISTQSEPAIDTWVHVAGVFDRGLASIYVDGLLSHSVQLPYTSIVGPAPYPIWALGARALAAGGTADQFFVGSLDDVKLYSRALSASEVWAAAADCGF